MSRESSGDAAAYFTDSTGVNLISFIIATLHKNPKDRGMLLSLEEDLTAFIKDCGKQVQSNLIGSSASLWVNARRPTPLIFFRKLGNEKLAFVCKALTENVKNFSQHGN